MGWREQGNLGHTVIAGLELGVLKLTIGLR